MRLTINNTDYTFDLEDDTTPLLWVLRDILELTGTKYSCGIGQCGACTVHVDGKALRSCMLPVSSMIDKNIQTIEGAASNKVIQNLQKNWVEIDVPQCGYCQSGQLMSASALLSENTNPSREQIVSGMQGNLCRCGTYPRILEAIEKTIEDLNS